LKNIVWNNLQEGNPTSKILHLTDIHLDLSYTVGTNTDCGKPLCCTNNTEVAPSDDLAAGRQPS
jgi:sphingomyelin phosphodiesterase